MVSKTLNTMSKTNCLLMLLNPLNIDYRVTKKMHFFKSKVREILPASLKQWICYNINEMISFGQSPDLTLVHPQNLGGLVMYQVSMWSNPGPEDSGL